jgi:hypothetical protein
MTTTIILSILSILYSMSTIDGLLALKYRVDKDGFMGTVIPSKTLSNVINVWNIFKLVNSLILIFTMVVVTSGDHAKVKATTAAMLAIDPESMDSTQKSIMEGVGKVCDGVIPLSTILFGVSVMVGLLVIK